MEALFLKLCNLSLTASYLVLAVLAVRFLFRKAPKWVFCILWGLVALRLVFPVSIESVLSLVPSAQPLPPDIIYTATPQIQSGVGVIDSVVNPILSTSMTPDPGVSANPTQIWSLLLAWVWAIGVGLMLLYAFISWCLLKRSVATATRLEGNIKQSERVDSPFVLGILKPVIYLPYTIDSGDMAYVIAHEQAHIARRDHWWKPIGFMILSVYWFNPLLWVAYVLLCRDIEAACDEKVIGKMEKDELRAYSTALLNCSVHRRRIAACPLAFGEVGVKDRIKKVMNYKKPAFWLIVIAVVAGIVLAVCFLTNPTGAKDSRNIPELLVPGTYWEYVPDTGEESPVEAHFKVGEDGSITGEILKNGEKTEFSLLWRVRGPAGFSEFYGCTPEEAIDIEGETHLLFTAGFRAKNGNLVFEMTDGLAYFGEEEVTFRSAEPFPVMQTYGVTEVTYENGMFGFSVVAQQNTPAYMLDEYHCLMSMGEHESESAWTQLGRPTPVKLTRKNFDKLFRNNDGQWAGGASASSIRRNNVKAWRLVYNGEHLYYLLQQENGDVYLAYGYCDYSEKNDPYSDDTFLRWLFKLAPQKGEKVTELIPGTTYVSWQCLYMSPLSSFAAVGGDSGRQYIVGEDYFATVYRQRALVEAPGEPLGTGSYAHNMITVPKWEWQAFPYTPEEWADLFQPKGLYSIDIHALYDEILYQPLSTGMFLLRVDGDIWLVELTHDPEQGDHLWSIYSLVPESAMGSATWGFNPERSWCIPAFSFTFDMPDMEISAVCSEGALEDLHDTNYAGPSITIPSSKCLYWSPDDVDGNVVTNAEIRFTVQNGSYRPYAGTIYITLEEQTDFESVYRAKIVGTGLHLAQLPEYGGGLITGVPNSTDHAADLKAALTEKEFSYEQISAQAYLSGEAVSLRIADAGMITLYRYADAQQASADAKRISSDGYTITQQNGDGTATILTVDWVSSPHWYRRGNRIVCYVGENSTILEMLDGLLGKPFTGRNGGKKIHSITDLATTGEYATASALELFYSDGTYEYLFPSIRSDLVIVTFSDGTEKPVKAALADGEITIADLDTFGIEYLIRTVSPSYKVIGVMYQGELYTYMGTGLLPYRPAGFTLAGEVKSVDNTKLPTEDWCGSNVRVGQQIYAKAGSNRIYLHYPTGYSSLYAEFCPASLNYYPASSIAFDVQYIRTGGSARWQKFPNAQWITDTEELQKYYTTNKEIYSLDSAEYSAASQTASFKDAIAKYDEAFFETKDLALVVLQEGSGTMRHAVNSVLLWSSGSERIQYSLQPEILRYMPEGPHTTDEAIWHIFIEVDKQYGKSYSDFQMPIIYFQ